MKDSIKIAIVLIAVIAVLLFIMLNILCCGPPPAFISFEDQAKSTLQRAFGSPGAVFPSPEEVQFSKDTIYPPNVFEAAAWGREVKFTYSPILEDLCKLTADGSLEINNDFKSRFYVLCGEAETDPCCISIGEAITSINDC